MPSSAGSRKGDGNTSSGHQMKIPNYQADSMRHTAIGVTHAVSNPGGYGINHASPGGFPNGGPTGLGALSNGKSSPSALAKSSPSTLAKSSPSSNNAGASPSFKEAKSNSPSPSPARAPPSYVEPSGVYIHKKINIMATLLNFTTQMRLGLAKFEMLEDLLRDILGPDVDLNEIPERRLFLDIKRHIKPRLKNDTTGFGRMAAKSLAQIFVTMRKGKTAFTPGKVLDRDQKVVKHKEKVKARKEAARRHPNLFRRQWGMKWTDQTYNLSEEWKREEEQRNKEALILAHQGSSASLDREDGDDWDLDEDLDGSLGPVPIGQSQVPGVSRSALVSPDSDNPKKNHHVGFNLGPSVSGSSFHEGSEFRTSGSGDGGKGVRKSNFGVPIGLTKPLTAESRHSSRHSTAIGSRHSTAIGSRGRRHRGNRHGPGGYYASNAGSGKGGYCYYGTSSPSGKGKSENRHFNRQKSEAVGDSSPDRNSVGSGGKGTTSPDRGVSEGGDFFDEKADLPGYNVENPDTSLRTGESWHTRGTTGTDSATQLSIRMRSERHFFKPKQAYIPLQERKWKENFVPVLREDIKPLERRSKGQGEISSFDLNLMAKQATTDLLPIEDDDNVLPHDITLRQRKFLLNGTGFENTAEKEDFIQNSGEFDQRLNAVLEKREAAVRKVLERFEDDFQAASDRWNLKAPALDMKYLLEGEPTL